MLKKGCFLIALASLLSCGSEKKVNSNAVGEGREVDLAPEQTSIPKFTDLIEGMDPKDGESYYIPQTDDTVIEKNFVLVSDQTAIKSQGRRGTCSIFATMALAEHIYKLREGEDIDFSEQYLNWSVKDQLNYFPRVSGSSPSYNLSGLIKYGAVLETLWPYENNQWDEIQDEDCVGNDYLPTKCYTNGMPPEEALNSEKYVLDRKIYLKSEQAILKSYMQKEEVGVLLSVPMFYQAWNHGKTILEINNQNKEEGAIVYPSRADITHGRKVGGGHAVYIVGWDDEKEFPLLDSLGNPLEDENKNIVYEKGFYLIKNSWGSTGSWGSKNEHGAGYGWISFDYVEKFGRTISAL